MLTALIATLIYFTFFKYRHLKITKATAKVHVRQGYDEQHKINYRIEFITKKASREMQIDELWIDRKLYKFKITRQSSHELVAEFSEKESLKIDAYEPVEDIHSLYELPRNFNGAAMIGYRVNNKKMYLAVDKIEYV